MITTSGEHEKLETKKRLVSLEILSKVILPRQKDDWNMLKLENGTNYSFSPSFCTIITVQSGAVRDLATNCVFYAGHKMPNFFPNDIALIYCHMDAYCTFSFSDVSWGFLKFENTQERNSTKQAIINKYYRKVEILSIDNQDVTGLIYYAQKSICVLIEKAWGTKAD